MPSLEVNGSRINYAQVDCECGSPCQDLVMIHGLATNMAFWYYPHAANFSKHYRVTLYDLRGHGRSPATSSGYTPRDMRSDLQHLLDHLGIGRAHFIAHSFGGAIALDLACRHPELFASLALVDTHISAVRRLPETRDWKFGKLIQPILDRYRIEVDTKEPYFGYKLLSAAARLHEQNKDIPPELERILSPLIGRFSKRTAGQWLNLLKTTRAEEELMGDDGLSLDSLQKLNFPILAFYGEHSQAMSTGEQLLQVWPHADFRRMRDAGHFFPRTRPSEFIKICRHFWDNACANGIPFRNGESLKCYFRSDRFYSREGKWFFDTRESAKEGPFDSFEEAREYLGSTISSVYVQEAV